MCNVLPYPHVKAPPSTRVSVIYVSWNTSSELRRSMDFLLSQGKPSDMEVIVVDNSSSDGTPNMVRDLFPEVLLIANSDNRGFAAAANQGWLASTGRFCLLLNPDTCISLETVGVMAELLSNCDAIGACAPVLRNEEGMGAPNAVPFPPLTVRLAPAVRPRPHGASLHVPAGPWGTVTGAHWLIGACLFIRREAWEMTGGFDEGYFLYWEDADWCYRALKAGWDVALLNDHEATHLGNRSGRQVPSRLRTCRLHDGYFRFLASAHGRFAARVIFLSWLLKAGAIAAFLGPAVLFCPAVRPRHTFEVTRFLFCLAHLGRPFLLCRFGRNYAP